MMEFGFHLVEMLPIQCVVKNANPQTKKCCVNAKQLKIQLKKLDVRRLLCSDNN